MVHGLFLVLRQIGLGKGLRANYMMHGGSDVGKQANWFLRDGAFAHERMRQGVLSDGKERTV